MKHVYMEGEEYVKIAIGLGLNIRSLGKFLRIGERTSYRYAYGAIIPPPTADLLRALNSGKITMPELESLRFKNEKPAPKKAAKKKRPAKKK